MGQQRVAGVAVGGGPVIAGMSREDVNAAQAASLGAMAVQGAAVTRQVGEERGRDMERTGKSVHSFQRAACDSFSRIFRKVAGYGCVKPLGWWKTLLVFVFLQARGHAEGGGSDSEPEDFFERRLIKPLPVSVGPRTH